MKPIKYENNVAIFYTSQLDLYGEPDYYGYRDYLVIEDTGPQYVYDYQMELDRKMRPVHRYNRVERFSFTLAQLLGFKGEVPLEVLETIKETGARDWNSIRHHLKINKLNKYYNRVSAICYALGYDPPIRIKCDNTLFRKMVNEFMVIQNNYKLGYKCRKYFPSIRYIALKILEANGAEFEEGFQFIRTKRKLNSLNDLWNKIMN